MSIISHVLYCIYCDCVYCDCVYCDIQSIHDGPILEMTIEQTSTLLASGSSDKSIKIWDIDRKYWTHNLKGHTGVIT